MSYTIEYERWLSKTDPATQSELKEAATHPGEVENRFGTMLAFGTAGLRGIMAAGLNRMNVYTVRQATQGLANVIAAAGQEAKDRGVAIAYDCRNHSREFALETARVLAAAGIRSFVFDELRPTPELSFAIRELNCIAGVNVTASHNPKEYNGYKVYWEDGAQLGPEKAEEVQQQIRENDIFNDVHVMDFAAAQAQGLIRSIGAEIDEKFMAKVLEQAACPEAVAAVADTFKIIYTPFHGAGYRLVPEVLRRAGFKNILAVAEQTQPDGNFPTVKSPNPEEKEGFSIAIAMAKKEGIDLIIGTDPDADRVGVVVRDGAGEYVSLTGNQVGVLLVDYIISAKKEKGTLPSNGAVVSTIVSTAMTDAICKQNQVALFRVLTGFKFIGEKIKEFEASGAHTFLLGFEESYGYLAGTYARDKDAVVGSMLIAEMAAWYKNKGITLFEALGTLYKKYGYYAERTVSVKMEGFNATEHMADLMKHMRSETLEEIGGVKVTAERDYLKGTRQVVGEKKPEPTGLPESDVLYYELADGNTVIVRPSGTEPKVKLYLLVKGKDAKDAESLLDQYEQAMRELMK
ncbi:phospho-sugar mutase [Ethanoligenens sp.]|uniref:phospho-sugar mutase n=1 Tax=Ethanoligenens sp. TaxID=2099655 RepID=UPI0039E95883